MLLHRKSSRRADRSPKWRAPSASTGRTWARRRSASASSARCSTLLAYKPILRMLETRRQQIAAGLANAEKIAAELARIEAERQEILIKAGSEGKQLIEEARVAAAHLRAEEAQKATQEAEQIVANAPRGVVARSRAHARRAQARGRPAGRADDRVGDRQGADRRRSSPARGRDREAAQLVGARDEDDEAVQADGATTVSAVSGRRQAGPRARPAGGAASRRRFRAQVAGRAVVGFSAWCASIAHSTAR